MNGTNLRSRARQWWRKEIRPLLVLALVVCSLRSSLADWSDVPTGSMKPTILEGDRVYVNKLAYDLKANCQAVRITGVSAFVSATMKIAGMRFDEVLGSSRSVSIKAGANSVVPKGKLPKTLKSPKRICG